MKRASGWTNTSRHPDRAEVGDDGQVVVDDGSGVAGSRGSSVSAAATSCTTTVAQHRLYVNMKPHPGAGPQLDLVARRPVRRPGDRRRRSRGASDARGFTGLRFSHGFLVQRLVEAEQAIAALAAALEVTQQAVSKTVAELEGLGYVRRRPDPRDARVRLVVAHRPRARGGRGRAGGAGGGRRGAARAPRPAPGRRRDARPARGPRGPRAAGAVRRGACARRLERAVNHTQPLCPSCGQPASTALAGAEHDWECRNEACPEFGQPIDPNEPPPPDPPSPEGPRAA